MYMILVIILIMITIFLIFHIISLKGEVDFLSRKAIKADKYENVMFNTAEICKAAPLMNNRAMVIELDKCVQAIHGALDE